MCRFPAEYFAHILAGSIFGNGRLQLAFLLYLIILTSKFMVSAIDLAKRASVTRLKTLAAAFNDFKTLCKLGVQQKGARSGK